MSGNGKIRITAGGVTLTAALNGSSTARRIAAALPLAGRADTWGDEIYFAIPVSCPPEKDAGDVVPLGAVAYWPPGRALCLFFGPTPASEGEECRAASPVNLVGAIEGDPAVLKAVPDGAEVTVEPAD